MQRPANAACSRCASHELLTLVIYRRPFPSPPPVMLQYKVYVAPELGGNATEVLWCGLRSLNDSTVCHLKLSSRQPSYVTIKGEHMLRSCHHPNSSGANLLPLHNSRHTT